MAQTVDRQDAQGVHLPLAGSVVIYDMGGIGAAITVTFCNGLGQHETAGQLRPILSVYAVELGDLGLIDQPEPFESALGAREQDEFGADAAYDGGDGWRGKRRLRDAWDYEIG